MKGYEIREGRTYKGRRKEVSYRTVMEIFWKNDMKYVRFYWIDGGKRHESHCSIGSFVSWADSVAEMELKKPA